MQEAAGYFGVGNISLWARLSRGVACSLMLAFAGASWGQAACQLPQAIKSPEVRAVDWRNLDAPTDYLALVLSWSPEHCAKQTSAAQRAKHAFQCQQNSFGFVVHGLWPQNRQGQSAQDHPRHCKSSTALPVDLLKRHLCTVPGTDLMQNEWQAHGTCGWQDAPSYFNAIEALMGQIKRPAFADIAPGAPAAETAPIKSGQLKQALVDANSGLLKREHIRVHVASGNRLKEVWICLSGVANPQPIACPAGGTPDSQQIKVKAPRPSSTPSAPAIDEPGDAADLACPARQSKFAGYKTAAKNALWSMYANGGKELYCEAPFASGTARKTAGGLQLNIEHVLPKSKISVTAGQGDLHNLWPSILKVNEARSNYSLTDDIPGEQWAFADASQDELASCDFEVESVQRPGGKVTVVEPAPHARGRIARAVLHMALAYQVRLSESEWAMYLAWHEQSAPAADEQRRNDEIEQLQGTRNPFIDSPTHGRVLVQSCRP